MIRFDARIGVVAAALVGFAACARYEASPTTATEWQVADHAQEGDDANFAPAVEEAGLVARGAAMAPPKASAKPLTIIKGGPDKAPEPDPEPDAAANDGGDVRSWFPEAFLWRPIVETDASGRATVEVRVPDSLTTWRVLALAHSRDGQQAGTVATFDSRLDLYVDPVVPGWLFVGDAVEVPIQVVNTTASPVASELSVVAGGALAGAGREPIALGAYDSLVRRADMVATAAGPATIRATLSGSDAAERSIVVSPAGRPVTATRGGTLSSPRTLSLNGPEGADPRTQELTVRVFPGPLAVLQAEVERAGAGASGATDAAYGFLLAGRLKELSARASVEADGKVVRRLQILAWQRVVGHARSPGHGTAADLLTGLRGVDGHDLAEELADRLVRTLVSGQRADGSWARQGSGSLQLVIAQTAFAARVLPEDRDGARIRASGALERYARDIEDPYTAALALASGLVDGDTATHLRTVLAEGVTTEADGRRSVSVPDARNPWDNRPSKPEMLAWVALATDDASVRGDLVAELMGGWDATWGFGAGPADAIALEAVLEALPGLDREVEVVLTLGGAEVARQKLDPAQPKVPAVLLAAPGGADAAIGLRAEPEVPGLAFVATLESWVPWTGEEALPGVDVEVTASPLRVGVDGTVTITLAAPSGSAVVVEQGLPAGATVDDSALDTRIIRDVEVKTDRVRFVTKTFAAGEIVEVEIPVRPAFAGRFSTIPLKVSVGGRTAELAPMTWVVDAN